jgi:cytochrome c553
MVMPAWWQSLTEQQIWDLVAYVRTLHQEQPAGDLSRGTALYDSYCWTCHGKTGKGDGPIAVTYQPRPRDLTDRAYLSTRTDRDLYNAISQGGGAVERSPTMPGWGGCSHPRRSGISSRMSVNSQNSHDPAYSVGMVAPRAVRRRGGESVERKQCRYTSLQGLNMFASTKSKAPLGMRGKVQSILGVSWKTAYLATQLNRCAALASP